MTIIGVPTASGPSSDLPRLSTITARVINLLGSDASLSTAEAESLVQTRYEDLYESWSWSKRLRDFAISLVAQIESDDTTLVTVSNGNSTVISAGAPFTDAMNGRQLTLDPIQQYFYVRVVDASTLELQDGEGNDYVWPGDTASGVSWRLFQTIYSLPSNVEGVISLAGQSPLEELDGGRDRLDAMDPARAVVNTHPTYWMYAGINADTFARNLEIWPVPTEARLLRGQYNRTAPVLTADSVIDLPAALLVYAAAADACHLLHAKQGTMESMWENKALFFERKSEEARKKFEARDFERTSPPTHIGRSSMDRTSQFTGTDYEVSHQLESP